MTSAFLSASTSALRKLHACRRPLLSRFVACRLQKRQNGSHRSESQSASDKLERTNGLCACKRARGARSSLGFASEATMVGAGARRLVASDGENARRGSRRRRRLSSRRHRPLGSTTRRHAARRRKSRSSACNPLERRPLGRRVCGARGSACFVSSKSDKMRVIIVYNAAK